jgi:hypothetical protein
METLIAAFLLDQGWVDAVPEVRFLAAGEYNQNYLVQDGSARRVFRINHGSQLGLADQIGYEFKVLRCVALPAQPRFPCACIKTLSPSAAGSCSCSTCPGAPLGL